MLNKFAEALQDCKSAVRIDRLYFKVIIGNNKAN
jgi:hypothetical protein